MADLVLPRGEIKVLQAEDEDYERGMLVKLLDDGGYKVGYWYDKPNKPYPVEIIVDGESIKKDGKVVELKFHPKDYYDKVEEGWSDKYKKSINCNNPKGFSQKAHCAGRKKRESVMTSLKEDKLQRKAFDIIKDLNNKYPTYNVKYLGAFNKVVKHLKDKLPGVSNLNLGKIALDYHSYRKGDMGVKIPTIKKMALTMRKVGVKEMKVNENTDMTRAIDKGTKITFSKRLPTGYAYLAGKTFYVSKKGINTYNMLPVGSYNEKDTRTLDAPTLLKLVKNRNISKVVTSRGKNITKLRLAHKEGLDDLKALPKDLKKSIKKNRNEVFFESNTEDGMVTNHIYYEIDGKGYGYTLEFVNELNEAEYQGRKVKLGKIMQGDQKKFKVYVKNPKGNVVKVNFGQGGDAKGGTMRIRKSNAAARKSFRARHNCDNPGPRHKARYWSCRKW